MDSKIEGIILLVEETRRENNILWMDMLRLAFEVAPEEASKIMKKINKNDKEITKWLGKL